jgi:multidrug transporter EmrE-like cation transporter
MLFLILSIICSVSVGVIFKIARRYPINIPQIVGVNYLLALALCYFFFSPDLAAVEGDAPWAIYISLGILMPSI